MTNPMGPSTLMRLVGSTISCQTFVPTTPTLATAEPIGAGALAAVRPVSVHDVPVRWRAPPSGPPSVEKRRSFAPVMVRPFRPATSKRTYAVYV
jgi:hypothetical protein